MNNTGKIALGIAGAAAIGTFLGLLVAPQKGSKFQKTLTKKGSEVINQLIDFVLMKQKNFKTVSEGAKKKASQSRAAASTAKSRNN